MKLKLIEDKINMFRFGHLYFNISADAFLKCFDYGDSVYVRVNGTKTMEVPVCGSYEDLFPGEPAIRVTAEEQKISLIRNCGAIGVEYGILKKAEPGSELPYTLTDDLILPVEADIELAEKAKFLKKTVLSRLTYSTSREDYHTDISDSGFANFREIRTTGMKPGNLYRSASPIDPFSGRNEAADRLAREAGIRTIINLSDSKEKGYSYPGFSDTYSSGCNIAFVSMSVSYRSDEFRDMLASCMRAIIEYEGPYMFHCLLGKDRTGFVAAVFELLMGAGIDEVKEDFLKTYENLYGGLKDGSGHLDEEKKDLIRQMCSATILYAMGLNDEKELCDGGAVENYLMYIGLTPDEIEKVKAAL